MDFFAEAGKHRLFTGVTLSKVLSEARDKERCNLSSDEAAAAAKYERNLSDDKVEASRKTTVQKRQGWRGDASPSYLKKLSSSDHLCDSEETRKQKLTSSRRGRIPAVSTETKATNSTCNSRAQPLTRLKSSSPNTTSRKFSFFRRFARSRNNNATSVHRE